MGLIYILEDFQTSIVGIIGFIGVIVTLIVNARISRSHARDIRRHEKLALVRGLLVEIESHTTSINKTIKDLKDHRALIPGEELCVPFLRTPIFDGNVSRIGLISDSYTYECINGFLLIKEYNNFLTLLNRLPGNGLYQLVNAQEKPNIIAVLEGMLPNLGVTAARLRDESS